MRCRGRGRCVEPFWRARQQRKHRGQAGARDKSSLVKALAIMLPSNRNLRSNKTRGTIQKKYFLSFCSARIPARWPFQVFTKILSSHAPAVIGGGKRCAVPLSLPWFLKFQIPM